MAAVTKKFRWTNADGETMEVEIGADGGNVTVDGKPLTDVLDEIVSKAGNVIAESGEITSASYEIKLSTVPVEGTYYFIPPQYGCPWDTISWGNAGADEYGTLQGNAVVKQGQAALIKYNGGAGAESGTGAFDLIAAFSSSLSGLFTYSVTGSSGRIDVDYGDISSLDVYLGDNTCLYVSDMSDVVNISLNGSGSNQTDLNYAVLTQLNNAKHIHANKSALDTITAAKVSDWDKKAAADILDEEDVLTAAPGIYQIKNNCTHLPSDIGDPEVGITLIVSPESSFFGSNNWKNLFIIANYYNDIAYTKIWTCQVIGETGYDMPWTLIHDSSAKIYSNTPVQIGVWMDGTPIWRQAFEDAPEQIELSDQSFDAKSRMNVISHGLCKIIDQRAYRSVMDTPEGMIDYGPAENDSSATFIITANTKRVYGYVDFITPASNIKTT